jgi:acetyl-CoA acetyltransferase
VARALVVGAGETPYTRGGARPDTRALLALSARLALEDAGLSPRDVDGLAVASFTLAPDHAADLAWRLGLRLRWLMEDTNGGASGLNMLAHGARGIEAGDARVVLVLAGDAFGPGDFRRLVDEYNAATRDHLAPLPTGGPNALFALLTRRHMLAHGLAREDYGRLVVAQRAWAAVNPAAVRKEPLTLADYLAAPMVADPLCVHDCVPVVSGADAVVITASDGAERPAAAIRALVASFNADGQEGDGLTTGLGEEAEGLWSQAGLGPADVDLAAVYDDYPAMVLVQLGDLGLAPGGDPRRLLERIERRALPVNTSGGQLGAGQAGAGGGLHGVVEAVRQLRGAAVGRQVAGARTALVTGYGMVAYRYGACANAAVLARVE